MNLFSMFDPICMFGIPLNWVSVFISLFLLPGGFWVCSSQVEKTVSMGILFVKKEFATILSLLAQPGSVWVPVSLFIFLVSINLGGLVPYFFPSSSHLVFSVSLALPIWLGHVLYSWILQPNFMLAHLVPLGTPPVLMPFMVLIEMISSVIRPLTLSVRLVANIIAGHLLLTLLASAAEGSSNFMVVFLILGGLVVLSVLESVVAFIQGYVFSVLMTLYVGEVQSLTIMG